MTERYGRLKQIASLSHPCGVLSKDSIAESGTIGAPPTVVNAVIDALSSRGVESLDMPLTSARVWAAANRQTAS
jgi:aerobic carbon-monoxide dehydrogenase large subunit